MDAVESGDMETVRALVREAEEAAGYDADEHAYHGTDAFGFTEFNMDEDVSQGEIFVAYNKETAQTYAHDAPVKEIGRKQDRNQFRKLSNDKLAEKQCRAACSTTQILIYKTPMTYWSTAPNNQERCSLSKTP